LIVSGLVTSPYDQERICSGDAKLMRNERNSVVSNTDLPKVNKSSDPLKYRCLMLPPQPEGGDMGTNAQKERMALFDQRSHRNRPFFNITNTHYYIGKLLYVKILG
jgi:hypothetical protein